jgi:hypothetical protein
MADEYGALCTTFWVNQKLTMKMDLPSDRETLLALFDRLRRQRPHLNVFRRYDVELVLESDPDRTPYEWVALRRASIRSGVEHPETARSASEFHRSVLEVAPFFLSVTPLDVDALELCFGFDLDAEANRSEIVFDALYRGSPLAQLADVSTEQVLDCQPFLAIVPDSAPDTQLMLDIKARVNSAELRQGRYQASPISIMCRARRSLQIATVDELPLVLPQLGSLLEAFVDDRVIPGILAPIRDRIMSRPS